MVGVGEVVVRFWVVDGFGVVVRSWVVVGMVRFCGVFCGEALW